MKQLVVVVNRGGDGEESPERRDRRTGSEEDVRVLYRGRKTRPFDLSCLINELERKTRFLEKSILSKTRDNGGTKTEVYLSTTDNRTWILGLYDLKNGYSDKMLTFVR